MIAVFALVAVVLAAAGLSIAGIGVAFLVHGDLGNGRLR